MAERTRTGYRRLFEVRMLHHYWLDDGRTVFDFLPEGKRNKRLLLYDCRSFLSAVPTPACERMIKGFRGVFKSTAPGFVVAVPEEAFIPDDALFEFVVTVQHAGFFTYTALTLAERKIYASFYRPEERMYRYKENVFVLSNLTGVSREAGTGKSLFLSGEYPALTSQDKAEALYLSDSKLYQLTSDQPGTVSQLLHEQANSMPVFVHQGDVPEIVPPAGLTGAPARGVLLSDELPDNVFAVVRIAAQKPGDADYSCTQNNKAKAAGPVFQIRFKNRSTVWKYYNKNTGAFITALPGPLPLTMYGNAGSRQKPGEGIKVSFDNVITNRITEVRSEVYE